MIDMNLNNIIEELLDMDSNEIIRFIEQLLKDAMDRNKFDSWEIVYDYNTLSSSAKAHIISKILN